MHALETRVAVFRFPEIFPNIQQLSKISLKLFRPFPKTSADFQNISKDFRRFSENILKTVKSLPNFFYRINEDNPKSFRNFQAIFQTSGFSMSAIKLQLHVGLVKNTDIFLESIVITT